MIRKWNVVEVVIGVVGVESCPPAIAAQQALDPLARTCDCGVVFPGRLSLAYTVQRHGYDGGVVEVRIVRISVLKSPAAGANIGTPCCPIALHVEHLLRQKPLQATTNTGGGDVASRFQQGVAGQSGV